MVNDSSRETRNNFFYSPNAAQRLLALCVVESTSRKIRPGGVAAFNGADEETLLVAVEIRNAKDLPDATEIARAIRTRRTSLV